MAFECKHCGQCCIDECTQISISAGDIVRICSFLNCGIGEIMPKIGMRPFGDPERPNNYEYELGLSIPCGFRVHGKCTIYPARPLNCRIFPYFIIAGVPKERLKEIIDPSHKCISEGIDFSDAELEKYREYSKFIGSLIMKEAQLTEKFYSANAMNQSVVLPAYVFPAEDPNDVFQMKEITKSKIKMAMSLMNPKQYEGLQNKLQNFILRHENDFAQLSEINAKEAEILGKCLGNKL